MEPIILSVIMGVIAGICRSVIGYFKNSSDEDFSFGKFLKTLGIMAIAGLVIGLFTPDWKLAFASSFTGGVVIQDLLKSYINRK